MMRRVWQVCGGVVGLVLFVGLAGAFLDYQPMVRWLPPGWRHPDSLQQVGVKLPAPFLAAQPWQLPPLAGPVRHLVSCPRGRHAAPELAALTPDGVAFLALDGSLRRTVKLSALPPGQCPTAVDLDGDGRPELLVGSADERRLTLYDEIGEPVWSLAAATAVDRLCFVGEEGREPLCMALPEGPSLRLVDHLGRTRWEVPVALTNQVRAVDLDGDGHWELVHDTPTGLCVRDESGRALREIALDAVDAALPPWPDWSLCRYPTGDSPLRILYRGAERLGIADLSGSLLSSLPLPYRYEAARTEPWLVRWRPAEPEHLLLVVACHKAGRWSLLDYDPAGQLAYHEVLAGDRPILAVVPQGQAEGVVYGAARRLRLLAGGAGVTGAPV